MRKLAKMSVVIKDPTMVDPPDQYSLNVSFTFGDAELRAYAVDEQTGEEAETSVVFIAD